MANSLVEREFYHRNFLCLSGDIVASSNELPVLPDTSLKKARSSDYLFIVASYDFRTHDTSECSRLLWESAAKYKFMVGLDTGPWLMASAGLLDGHGATLHWGTLDSFSERFLNVDTVRNRVVNDINKITCAGAMSGFDLTRSMIEEHLETSVALDVDSMLLRDYTLAL